MSRHDYGPSGCCAKKAAQATGLVVLTLAAGVGMFKLSSSVTWRIVSAIYRKAEARRGK